MSDPGYIEVVGWEEFQHYKDRDPPWIKLHRKLLDNYGWACLQDASKAHLVGIWLLAARHHNRLPADPEWIRQRIGATSTVDLQVLTDAGFIRASKPLAPCKQSATLEREAEAERETTSPQGGAVSVQGVRRNLPEPSRAAYDGYRRGHPNPAGFDGELRMTADGMRGPAYPWPVIGRALEEMAASADPSFSPVRFRAYCRRIVAGDPPPKRGSAAFAADIDRLIAEEEAKRADAA